MNSGSRPAVTAPADLPCLDGRHDFEQGYRLLRGEYVNHRCPRCGWTLDKVLDSHPLREMAHYLRVARKVPVGGKGSP